MAVANADIAIATLKQDTCTGTSTLKLLKYVCFIFQALCYFGQISMCRYLKGSPPSNIPASEYV